MRETRGKRSELVRHFLARFFDSDLVTAPGQWMRAATGVVAVLLSACILMIPTFAHRYACLEAGHPSLFCPAVNDYPAMYLYLLRTDSRWLIGLAFCVTALAIAVQWESLFPSLRDCLALAGLPISAREIFWSKLAALLLALAAFVLAMNTLPSLAFAWIVSGRLEQHGSLAMAAATFFAASAACVFVFFAILALQGLLLNLLPPRAFERVSVYAQSVLFTASVAALPFLWHQPAAPWWPPNWFAGLWTGMLEGSVGAAQPAIYALTLTPALAVAVYLLSYHRHQRLLLEAPGGKRREPLQWPEWLLPRDPREQAIFTFTWKTLLRSRIHRLMLQVCAGLAIAWIIGAGGLRERDAVPVVMMPLAAAVFVIAGLRYLFSLPSELRANWPFQMIERDGRAAWMRGVDFFVVRCGLAPIYACSLPAAIVVFGWWQALRVTILGFFLALVIYEFLFREWHKAPFTCSYLPGKRQFWQILVASFGALSYLATATLLVHEFSKGWVTFAAGFPLLLGGWRWMRRNRTAEWQETPLLWDEAPEPVVLPLDLMFEPGSLDPENRPSEPAARRIPLENFSPDDDRDPMPFLRPAGMLEDLLYGFRLACKNWRLSTAIVATLALGIGMNVSVFTLLNAVAFRPRVPDPDSFVRVSPIHPGNGMAAVGGASAADYLIYRDRSHSLRSLAASFRVNLTLENNRSTAAPALLVSCNFFAVYGATQPKSGRFFRPEECSSAAPSTVAVLAEEAWRDRFGSDPGILSRTVSIDDRQFTIVGIAPAATSARMEGVVLWVPYTTAPLLDIGFNPFSKPTYWLWLDGRLSPGVSRSAAQAELEVLARQLDSDYPGRKTSLIVTDGSMVSLRPILNRNTRDAFNGYWIMLFVMTVVGMVLFITCANVMTLLLSRAVARRREVAVRLSLGAPRMRLLRMLLTESLLLAGAAGALSLYIAWHVPALLFQFLANRRPDFSLAPDWRIFVFVFGVALLAGCISALAPALESLKVDLTGSLKGYGSAGGDKGSARLRTVLVTSQVALSLALLVGAGMLLQAYWRTWSSNPGYETRRVISAPLRFPAGSPLETSRALAQGALERVAMLPGVRAVARVNVAPFSEGRTESVKFADRGIETARPASFQAAAPGVLRLLGIPLLRGRDFLESDLPDRSALHARIIVSERLAREMSPDADPLGRTLESLLGPTYEIIGIARDVHPAITADPVLWVFGPWDRRQTFLLARFAGDTHATEDAMRNAVRGLRGDLLVTPRTLQSAMDETLADTWRLVMMILILGAVAMLLSVAGIYGVLSFTVTEKTRELGIRAALGATRADIFRDVLVAGAKQVLLGLFAGLWLALGADAAMRRIFAHAPFELDAANPGVYLGCAAVLGIAAFAAILQPARRGARSDPASALRWE